jgi:hypothetical protein
MTQPGSTGKGAADPVGGGNHVVAAGECLFSIAKDSGHFWENLWNHPQNKSLKEFRGSPHVLLPGDTVFIPPITPRTFPRPSDATHRFKLKKVPLDFELKILNGDQPRKGLRYRLLIEGRATSGTVPDDGIIKAKVMPSDQSGTLVLKPGPDQEEYALQFGDLDPAHSPSGAIGRLQNLGVLGTDTDADAVAQALSIFQDQSGLPVTGEVDDATARALCEAHGS